jgi:hypothetical protein
MPIISHARNASCSVWVQNFVTMNKERKSGCIITEWLNTAIEIWTIWSCILEVPYSNLGENTDYADRGPSRVFSIFKVGPTA